MLFEKILQNPDLYNLRLSYCSENNIEVCFSDHLDKNEEKVIILKIDSYYSSMKMHNPPPSIDCLILVKCDKKPCYNIHLVELKDIDSPKSFDKENIHLKFQTTIKDFLENKFKHIFMNETYCKFECYFVADPYRCSSKGFTDEEYLEYINSKGLKLDYFLTMEPLEFKGKISIIKPILPTPMISEC